MQITNYWNQPQAQQNKASTSAASTMDFLNTLGKGSDSNKSGSADANQSALAGGSMVTSFSASLAAANVDTASTGSDTSTTPDFTSMTRQQMRDWVNEQIKSGKMTFDQSSPFVGMSSDISVSKDFINVATDTTRVNFIENTQQGIAGALSRGDQVEAKQLQAALSAMLAAQGHNSQDASQSQTGSGSRVVEVGWLTASDVKLIQQTTGQTIDPSTGNAYDANGQKVALSQAAGSLVNTLSTIRQFGVSNSNGTSTVINGDITADDLQKEMQIYAGNPQGLTDTNNFSAVTQAIFVLNGYTANKITA